MSEITCEFVDGVPTEPQALADAVANGARLSVYLEPDTELDTFAVPKGRYLEAYPLPHACVDQDRVVGATRRTHVVHKLGASGLQHTAFFYTTVLPLYGLYAHGVESEAYMSGKINGKVFSGAQYSAMRFVAQPAGDLVWSDENADDQSVLVDAISKGRSLYIVFTDPDGLRRSHPLDLAFVFPDTNGLEFRTEHMLLPEIFLGPLAFAEKVRRSVDNLDAVLANPAMTMSTPFKLYSAFRCIDQTGAGYGVDDIRSDQRHQCVDVRVFANP